MKIFFRVDASSKIGSGHLMRCLTLSNALKNIVDSEITFITKSTKIDYTDLIREQGFRVISLTKPLNLSNSRNPLLTSSSNKFRTIDQAMDYKHTLKAIAKEGIINWLVIDHYEIDYSWEKNFRGKVKKIMVIDDLANRKHDCDLILDQNWFQNKNYRYDSLVNKHCIKLLGPKYALLRSEFQKYRKLLNPLKKKNINRIFIFFGGSDNFSLTQMVLNVLSGNLYKNIFLDVVVGKSNNDIKLIRKLCKDRNLTNLHVQVKNIASIMSKADLAIGAGGSTIWERMALNLESHVVISSDNQEQTVLALAKKNYINLIGYAKNINIQILSVYFKKWIINRTDIEKNYKINSMCDGAGAERVVNIMDLLNKKDFAKFTNFF